VRQATPIKANRASQLPSNLFFAMMTTMPAGMSGSGSRTNIQRSIRIRNITKQIFAVCCLSH